MMKYLLLLLPLWSSAQSSGRLTLTSPTGKVMDISMGIGRAGKTYHYVKRPDHGRETITFVEVDTLRCSLSVVILTDIKVVNGFVVRYWKYSRNEDPINYRYPNDYYLLDIQPQEFLAEDRKTVLNNTYPSPAWYHLWTDSVWTKSYP